MNVWKWEKLWPYRAVVAVDARDFSSLNSSGMQQINQDIRALLSEAMSTIGLSSSWERRYFGQHTGDGYVAGVSPECLPALVGCFPRSLYELLRNRPRPDGTPLQVRVSVHVGPLPDSGIGDPMVETHRLLDDGRLRDLLSRATPELTPLAMIVSERVYEDVFASGKPTGGVGPEEFARSLVRVKAFEKPAWVHVPGLDWKLADPGLLLSEPPESKEISGQSSPMAGQEPTGAVFNNHGGENIAQGYQQNFQHFGNQVRSIDDLRGEHR
ncbi:hypothetical protein ABZ512_08810 [Nocardiopsis dassonvillei]|uniref:hypothetical protein n=1 Tax=Nocardiopsis dassonvillei TaxID=2014 RepID=UPI0033F15FFA